MRETTHRLPGIGFSIRLLPITIIRIIRLIYPITVPNVLSTFQVNKQQATNTSTQINKEGAFIVK
ncbi:MAG: hypothetical protein ABIQ31_00260 [Ferruginibacter sp.]